MKRTYSFGYFHVLLVSTNSTKLQGVLLAHFIFLCSILNDFLVQTERFIAESSSWHCIKLSLNFLFHPWKELWLQRENTQAFKCVVAPQQIHTYYDINSNSWYTALVQRQAWSVGVTLVIFVHCSCVPWL